MKQEYCFAIELEFIELTELDLTPSLCVYPLESSKYRGFSYAQSEESFEMHMQSQYNRLITYLNDYLKNCIAADSEKEFLLQQNRLTSFFSERKVYFLESHERKIWKNESTKFVKSWENEINPINFDRNRKYAYRFFYRMSEVQLKYISRLLDYSKSINITEDLENGAKGTTPLTSDFYFQLKRTYTPHRHDRNLKAIFKALSKNGYIQCKPSEFVNIFTSRYPKQITPIAWYKPYSHLAYFIKKMSLHFLEQKPSPSYYRIATQYFFDKGIDTPFTPKKFRCDTLPREVDKKFIDSVFEKII